MRKFHKSLYKAIIKDKLMKEESKGREIKDAFHIFPKLKDEIRKLWVEIKSKDLKLKTTKKK